MAFTKVVCAFALVQAISAQCLNNGFNGRPELLNNNGCNGLNGFNNFNSFNGVNGLGFNGYSNAASTGGGFSVTSSSSVAPTGVSVVSENAFEGPLNVGGNLPLLGTVGLEGNIPSAGAGGVSYGCGEGAVGITAETPAGPVTAGANAPAPVPTGAAPVAAGPIGGGPIGGPIGAGPIGAGPIGAGPIGAGPIGAGPFGAGSFGAGLAGFRGLGFGLNRFGMGGQNCA